MPTKTNSLQAWIQMRNTQAQNLASVLELLASKPDPANPFDLKGARKQRDRIFDDLQRLAVIGIKQIDDQIAAGTLVKQIEDLAQKAEDEADKLKDATKTVAKITAAVDTAAGVVTKITQLPFL